MNIFSPPEKLFLVTKKATDLQVPTVTVPIVLPAFKHKSSRSGVKFLRQQELTPLLNGFGYRNQLETIPPR
jgi:hypothetical protein